MKHERNAGILLHPTSLPGRYGIGDLGPEAYNFVNFLEEAGQLVWQVLPLGPTGYGDSPYQCFSAFAGNPYLVSPDKLMEDGLLTPADVEPIPSADPREVPFGEVITYKMQLLRKAYTAFEHGASSKLREEFSEFCDAEAEWLDDFALFMAVKNAHGGNSWTTWKKDIKLRKADAVKAWRKKVAPDIAFIQFTQFLFFRQWKALKSYANGKGIKIVGDLPIFIAFDSADAWSHRNLFTIGKEGEAEFVAGVPPDYFSVTGQLWGNPLYRWKEMEKNDFQWWRQRITKSLEQVDIIRIDHFRGFDAYWEVPGDAVTAVDGRWVKAPGMKLFNSIRKHLGDLPIIAEDLGLITKSVRELRDAFNLPGMKILQFAFGTKMESKFLPHNHIENCIVYTGSHDNDTTRGYFEKAKNQDNDIYQFTKDYLNCQNDDLRFALIKAAYASNARMAVIPMQDILNVGSEGRMNFPGRLGGNWAWRFTWDQVPYDLSTLYRHLTVLYERPYVAPADAEKEPVVEEE